MIRNARCLCFVVVGRDRRIQTAASGTFDQIPCGAGHGSQTLSSMRPSMCEARPTEKQLMVCGHGLYMCSGRVVLSRAIVCSGVRPQLAGIHGECKGGCRSPARCKHNFEQDCTEAANPNGISGREWCYVEVLRRACPCRIRVVLWSSCLAGAGCRCRGSKMGLLRFQS